MEFEGSEIPGIETTTASPPKPQNQLKLPIQRTSPLTPITLEMTIGVAILAASRAEPSLAPAKLPAADHAIGFR
jgi:hypothetical protein